LRAVRRDVERADDAERSVRCWRGDTLVPASNASHQSRNAPLGDPQ
jgi:hypothetical protein